MKLRSRRQESSQSRFFSSAAVATYNVLHNQNATKKHALISSSLYTPPHQEKIPLGLRCNSSPHNLSRRSRSVASRYLAARSTCCPRAASPVDPRPRHRRRLMRPISRWLTAAQQRRATTTTAPALAPWLATSPCLPRLQRAATRRRCPIPAAAAACPCGSIASTTRAARASGE